MPAGTPLTPVTAGHCEPVSPDEKNIVWPWASACCSTASCPVVNPEASARMSHSPAEKLPCLAMSSVTHLLTVVRMSASSSDGPTYTLRVVTPGANAGEYWLSRSHSSSPEVSVDGVPTLIWFHVTVGRP